MPHNGRLVARLWGLGFRGHGDYAFWQDDHSFVTDEERGAEMSRQIAIQYSIVREVDPDGPVCVNIYGEVTDLYQRGLLDLFQMVVCASGPMMAMARSGPAQLPVYLKAVPMPCRKTAMLARTASTPMSPSMMAAGQPFAAMDAGSTMGAR